MENLTLLGILAVTIVAVGAAGAFGWPIAKAFWRASKPKDSQTCPHCGKTLP